jgi:RNA polymerase sigma-70 factor (ECF subfamily)
LATEGTISNETKHEVVVDDAGHLMAQVKQRDVAAFEALYDSFHRLVYGIAYRMLSDPMAAEDLTQGVFLKIWSAPESYQTGNFGGWISRVTRNRALDVLRSRSLHAEGELSNDIPWDGELDEAVFAKLDGQRVRAALASLPDEQRKPIELGFFGGATHEEIANRVGAPLGTVKTRIRTGLRKLRTMLDESAA